MDEMTNIGGSRGESDGAPAEVAFALTGLGGSNAFGAGFLQAALDCRIEPKIVSCTSGMIYWTWRWLEARRANRTDLRPGRLRQEVEAMIASTEPFPKSLDVLNTWRMAITAVPDAFRWARPEFFRRFLTTSLFGIDATYPDTWLDLFFPAQLMVPTRSPQTFADMGAAFTAEQEIGICFNSYLAETGTEYLHVNDAARGMLEAESDRMKHNMPLNQRRVTDSRPRRRSVSRTFLADITAQDLEDALWLTLYGAHSNVDRGGFANRLDGAYLRSVILSELTMVDAILMPRPVATQRTDFPSNYFEVEDFKTEMWWNASCGLQVDAIEFVNALVRNNRIKPLEDQNHVDFRTVRVVPIEIDVDRGYFDYFREDLATFDRGYNEACTAFARLWEDIELDTAAAPTRHRSSALRRIGSSDVSPRGGPWGCPPLAHKSALGKGIPT
jgi:hypothetical protein